MESKACALKRTSIPSGREKREYPLDGDNETLNYRMHQRDNHPGNCTWVSREMEDRCDSPDWEKTVSSLESNSTKRVIEWETVKAADRRHHVGE